MLTEMRRLLVLGVRGLGLAGMVGLVFMLGASSAVAAPTGEAAAFAQCPLGIVELAGCLAVRVESGEFTLGRLVVPIIATQTLQAGFTESEAGALTLFGAADGETLSKTQQRIPSDLSLCEEDKRDRKWFERRGHHRFDRRGHHWFDRAEHGLCEAIFGDRAGGLDATVELAGPVSSIGLNENAAFLEQGTALSLPLKLKLENPLLGHECYIGSDTNPIVVELTDGTAGPLKGKLGNVGARGEARVLVISGLTFVSDTFAAPAAAGCGIHGWLDRFVNTKLRLPSPAGTNTATLNGTHEQAGARFVRETRESEEETATTTTTTPPSSSPPQGHKPWTATHSDLVKSSTGMRG